jgi:hypothetical protein
MDIKIAFSAYNRPEYTRRALAAIMGMKGFNWVPENIFASVDMLPQGFHNSGVLKVFSDFGITPILADKKLGCNGNVKLALDSAWASEPDAVLMIEDDIIVCHDAWLYINWAARKFQDDQSVRTVTLFNESREYQNPLAISSRNFFCCWGWLTWQDRWTEMSEKWTTGDDGYNTSWDVVLSKSLENRKEIFPLISRAYNCGEFNGTHRGKAWPGILSSGLVDSDSTIQYEYH